MGFFGKVFGPKEKKVETIETTLDLLPTLIEKDFEAKRKELEIVVAKKIAEIKYLHSKSLKLLEDITKKEIEEKENKRMNKAAFTSKKQIEKQLEKILTKIDPTNRGNDLDDIKAFVGEGNSVLSNEIMAFRKNIVYTSVYLKDEMKALGEALQGMFTNFRELQKEIENVKEMFEFENIKNKINALNSLEIEKEKKQNEASEIKKLVEQKEKDITQSKKSLAELTRGKGAEELATIEKEKTQLAFEKQQLKTEISSLLTTIDRPLQRFNSLVTSGRWIISKEKQHLLEGMLTNPILALGKDPTGENFKEILVEVVKAIEDGKIDLKDREKEKKLNALNELLTFNFFEKVFWKLNEIQKKQTEIEKKLKENQTQKEIIIQEDKIKSLEKETESFEDNKQRMQKETEEINKKIRKENDAIISFSEKILEKKIILKSN